VCVAADLALLVETEWRAAHRRPTERSEASKTYRTVILSSAA
jgi:hypothetical protein